MAEAIPDYGTVVVGVLVGAFGGLLVGLVATQLVRFLGLLVGRNWESFSVVMPCVFLGALVCGWLLVLGR